MAQNLIYNFNLFSSTFNNLINTNQTVELLSSYFVTAALTILIVISLVLTFHNKGTAIHKVLGLLLLSIFVVFLWVFQTQFLFIYLVYILAFISAVLMLFLSVVLMLPVSTLSNKNTKFNNSFFLVIPLLNQIDFNFIIIVLIEAFVILLILHIWKNYEIKLLWQLALQWFQLSNYPFENLEKFSKYQNFIDAEFEKRYVRKNIFRFILKNLSFITKYYPEILQHPEVSDNVGKNHKIPKATPAIYLLIDVTIFIVKATSLLLSSTIVISKKLMYKPLLILMTIIKYLKNVIKVGFSKVFDSIIQFYLFINVLAIAFSINFLNTTSYVSHKDFSNSTEHVQGLGVLKNMLYDQYGSFLIISTLVLLIALIGAAVMTKNTKSKN